jgi:hypothetical protein
MDGVGLIRLTLLAAVVAVIAIFVVRGIENHQRAQAAQSAQSAYCQQYYANKSISESQSNAGQIPTVGSMLNLYNC